MVVEGQHHWMAVREPFVEVHLAAAAAATAAVSSVPKKKQDPTSETLAPCDKLI